MIWFIYYVVCVLMAALFFLIDDRLIIKAGFYDTRDYFMLAIVALMWPIFFAMVISDEKILTKKREFFWRKKK